MHLTEIAYYTRKAIIYGSIFFLFFIIVRQVLIFVIRSYRETHQPPPPGPSVTFGKIPSLVFSSQGKNYSYSFKLVTKEVGLPQMPDRSDVYFIPKKLPDLRANDHAKSFAAQLGFITEPKQDQPYMLLFTDPNIPQRSLLMNSVSDNLHIFYDPQTLANLTATSSAKPKITAQSEAQNFLNRYGLLLPIFDLEKTVVTFVSFDGNQFIESDEKKAQANRVDFFKRSIGDIPLVTEHFFFGTSYVVLGNNPDEIKAILEAQVVDFPVDLTAKATYPIKSSQQAWEELTGGQGYIANPPKIANQDILIRKVYLAFYEALDYQPYLQPVYVFEGDNNFIGYVAAVTKDWAEPSVTEIALPIPMRNSVLPTPIIFPSPQIDHSTEVLQSTPALFP